MNIKRFSLFFFSIILGVIILFYIIQKIGLDKIFQALRLFSWWHFVILILSAFFILFIYIKKWQILVKPYNYKTSWRKMFVAFLGCQTISFITPMVYVGGEGFKALLLKEENEKNSFSQTFTLIIIDKLAESLGLLTFFFLGGVLLIFYHSFVFGLLMIFLSLIVLMVFFIGLKVTSFFIFFIKLLGFNKVVQDKEKVKQEVNLIEQYLVNHRRFFLFNIILSFFALVFSALQIYLILFFLGLNINIFEVYLIKVATMIGGLIPTPGSIGGFEGSIVLAFSSLNLAVQTGLALTIIMRALQLVEIGVGSVLIFPHLTKTIFPKVFDNKSKEN